MMGRNHLVTGVCALEHAYVASVMVDRLDFASLTQIQHFTQSYLGFTELSVMMLPIYLGAYLIGTLLPDIDNPKSLLGRYIHIPVEHRTWLHAIYLYLIFLALGWRLPVFAWLFFGTFVHLFWDSFSACGNCWFYKILSDYRRYPTGAVAKKGHKMKLYHAGEWSEYLLVALIVAASVASFIYITR